MISQGIRTQIRAGETVSSAFMAGLDDFAAIARTVCAFLNSEGGTLLCGVDSNGRLLGLPANVDQVSRDLEAHLQADISPKALFTLSVEQTGDQTVLAIEVPIGRDRPYVFAGSVFVRSGARTRPADAALLHQMVHARAAEAIRWERRPAADLRLSELDSTEIRRMVAEATEFGRFAFRTPNDDFEVLRELALTGPSGLTQGADVLFGIEPSLRHPQTRVRVVAFDTNKAGQRFGESEWITGPLVQVLDQAFSVVRRNVRSTTTFPENEVRRREIPGYDFGSLREGMINALAHRDYSSFSGGVVISIYPERIEIWNSGRLPDGLKTADLRKNHPSIPTNPDISHVLYLRKLMERVGRGCQRIVEGCKAVGAPPPRWDDRPTGVTLTLYARKGGHLAAFIPNARQEALLLALVPGETIVFGTYYARYAMDVTDRQARRDLEGLERNGLLVHEGEGGARVYIRTQAPWPT